ncbi:putative protein N(5)-glutamine methyltransferase [Streptomyces sp. NPDC059740]|uniref:putative protein N(5)-glutamine methyltransferase n=1 Tax=Streptomyces sp. NPDC059740 TaxID=3346926 RepID=UPI003669C4FB
MSVRHPASPASCPPLSPEALVLALRGAGCVFAEEEARLLSETARDPAELTRMLDRRTAGLPLEQVVGWARFHGRRISLDPGVFVPRRRTEAVVDLALALAPPDPVVLDLCCGSGAVAVALAAALAATGAGVAELHAADIDPAAVACARRNLAPLGGTVHEGDLYAPLPAGLRGRVTLLVANTPYVPTAEIPLLPPEARLYEARVALDGGGDGLDVQRRVAARATRWLAPGGHLFMEVSSRQADRAVAVLTDAGLLPRVAEDEERDATVVVGTRPLA